MKKITLNKTCYYETIKFDDILIYSGYESHWNKQLTKKEIIKSKEVIKTLLPKLSEDKINELYKMEISHDYNKSKNIQKEQLVNKSSDYTEDYDVFKEDYSWYSFFQFFKYIIEFIGIEEYSDLCEQCGDYNYSIFIS